MIRGTPRHASPIHRLAPLLAALVLTGCASRLGPTASYEYGRPLTIDRSAGNINRYPNFNGDGTSQNHTIGFGAAWSLDDLIASGVSLEPRVGFALSSGLFESASFAYIDSVAPISTTRTFEVYSTLSVARIELPVWLALTDALGFAVAPWGSLRIGSGVVQTEFITAPSSARFPDSSTSRIVESGEAIASSRLRAGVSASIGYAVPLARGLTLRPEIALRADLTSLADGIGDRALSGGLTLSLLATLPSDADTAAPLVAVLPATDTLATPLPLPPVRGTIDLFIDAGAPLESTGTLERVEVPMAPVVRFANGSAELPDAMRLMTPERSARMTVDSLARLSPAELQERALDVLGMRMREVATARATVHGARDAAEDRSLARARAGAVRAYLADTWGIDSGRVRLVESTSRAREARITADAAVATPIVARWITRSYRAPRIGLRHEIEADAGVRYWEIVLRQGSRAVARITEATRDTPLGVLSLDGTAVPIVGELSIVDSLGSTVVVTDTLRLNSSVVQGPVERERRELVIGSDRIVERARAVAATVADDASITVEILAGGERTMAPFVATLLGEIERRGVLIGGLRVVEPPAATNPTNAPSSPVFGTLRVLIEQPYAPADN